MTEGQAEWEGWDYRLDNTRIILCSWRLIFESRTGGAVTEIFARSVIRINCFSYCFINVLLLRLPSTSATRGSRKWAGCGPEIFIDFRDESPLEQTARNWMQEQLQSLRRK